MKKYLSNLWLMVPLFLLSGNVAFANDTPVHFVVVGGVIIFLVFFFVSSLVGEIAMNHKGMSPKGEKLTRKDSQKTKINQDPPFKMWAIFILTIPLTFFVFFIISTVINLIIGRESFMNSAYLFFAPSVIFILLSFLLAKSFSKKTKIKGLYYRVFFSCLPAILMYSLLIKLFTSS